MRRIEDLEGFVELLLYDGVLVVVEEYALRPAWFLELAVGSVDVDSRGW